MEKGGKFRKLSVNLLLLLLRSLLLLGHIAVLRTQMRPIVTDRVAWSVCRSVCLSVTLVSPAMATNFGTKTAITGFVWTTATRQLVMEGVWVVGRQNADTADTLHWRDVAMATISVYVWGVHWSHLANMTEASVCGDDAALCQINLTTCY